ncbi:MAG: hypothetical protein BGO31_08145 [Bacteroidetes bacterium 43-16]|nr:MAG: hypothetical protein BGO31_08145 [Bacteroidetes bacterium 43-16]
MLRKISLLITLSFLFLIGSAKAQEINGYWYNDVKDAKIEIFKATDGKYYGKIVWLKEPNRDGQPKVDKFNSNSKLKTRPIMGLHILSGFKKSGSTYEDGTIYDPKNGKSYSCKITPDGNDKLNIRGYVGISLLGRTTVWTRTTK